MLIFDFALLQRYTAKLMSEKIIHISDSEKPRFQASGKVMRKLFPNDTKIISPWCERHYEFKAAQDEMYESVITENKVPHLLVVNYTVFYQLFVRRYPAMINLAHVNILLTTCYTLDALKALLYPMKLIKEPKILPVCTMGHEHCHTDRIRAALLKIPEENPFHPGK